MDSKKEIQHRYKEQLQDLLPSLGLATAMGVIVYIVHFLPIHKGLVLILQVVIGAAFYLAVSYVLQFEPFIYLVGIQTEPSLPSSRLCEARTCRSEVLREAPEDASRG